jgi:Type III secretion system YscX (type_III_YscX)
MTPRRAAPSPFVFDRGIDAILWEDGAPPSLPPGEVSPAFTPLKTRLEQLYALPTLDDLLDLLLEPQVQEAGLLLPRNFAQAVQGALEDLQACNAEKPRRRLREAMEVLKQRSELELLARMYLSALLQG